MNDDAEYTSWLAYPEPGFVRTEDVEGLDTGKFPVTMRKYVIIPPTTYRNGPAMLEASRTVTPQIGAVMRKHSTPLLSLLPVEPIPAGVCQCGCGKNTSPSAQTSRKWGTVKGCPAKYAPGHSRNTTRWLPIVTWSEHIAILPIESQTHGAVFVLIDLDDALRVLRDRWAVNSNGRTAGITTWDGGKTTRIHRRIMGDVPTGMVIDHVNRNPLDNRKGYLRIATYSQNGGNQLRKLGIAGFKGVTIDKSRSHHSKPWKASITKDGKTPSLGRFATPEDAARAYDKAARELFGEFALTNEDLGLYEKDSTT